MHRTEFALFRLQQFNIQRFIARPLGCMQGKADMHFQLIFTVQAIQGFSDGVCGAGNLESCYPVSRQ